MGELRQFMRGRWRWVVVPALLTVAIIGALVWATDATEDAPPPRPDEVFPE